MVEKKVKKIQSTVGAGGGQSSAAQHASPSDSPTANTGGSSEVSGSAVDESTALTPGGDEESGISRLIRANTVTEDDFEYQAGEVPSKFQSLGDARSKNVSKYSAASTFQIEKKYGLFSAVCVIVCVVIGSGIFINPQDAVNNVDSPGVALCIWGFMGIHSTIGALCYAELGTTLPVSGGDYAYINEAFGSFPGFVYQWCATFLFIPVVNAILARTVCTYFLTMVAYYAYSSDKDHKQPHPDPKDDHKVKYESVWTNPESTEFKIVLNILEIVLVIGVFVGNCLTTKFAEKLQNALTVAKLFACFLIIIVGIYKMSSSGFAISLEPELAFKSNELYHVHKKVNLTTEEKKVKADGFQYHFKLFSFSMAFYDVYFSFLGWTYLNFITEELDNPYRNLPIAICIALPLITVVYILMNISYLAILPMDILRTTKVIASDTIKQVFANNVGIQQGLYWVAPVVVMFSAFGALVGHVMAMARVLFVAPRFNHAPMFFNHIHVTRSTPIPSLLLQCCTTIIYIIMQNFVLVILMSCYTETTFTALALVGMVYLRVKKPDLERPIKLPIVMPIFFIFVSFVLWIMPIITIFTDWDEKLVHILTIPMVCGFIFAVLSGILAYLIFLVYPVKKDKLETFVENLCNTRRAD